MTDADATALMTSYPLTTVPSLAQTYASVPRAVLRADLLRYTLLWLHGGFYADVDTVPHKPVALCPSLSFLFPASAHLSPTAATAATSVADIAAAVANAQALPPLANLSLVLGLEMDEPAANPHTRAFWHWTRTAAFAQYAVYAPRRFSPLMRRALARALAYATHHNRATTRRTGGVKVGPVYTAEDVAEATGRGMLTDLVMDVLGETLPEHAPAVRASLAAAKADAAAEAPVTSAKADTAAGASVAAAHADTAAGASVVGGEAETEAPAVAPPERVTWAAFHALRVPLVIEADELSEEAAAAGLEHGGLLALPINVWSNGQRHSGADPTWDSPEACVNHRFAGAWRHSFLDWVLGIGG